jgi:hypothetical protein
MKNSKEGAEKMTLNTLVKAREADHSSEYPKPNEIVKEQ